MKTHCKHGHSLIPENLYKNGRCKTCCLKRSAARYKANPEKRNEQIRRNRTLRWDSKYREQAFSYQKSRPEKTLFAQAKYRAKKQNLPFNITAADITIPELCPVLGIPLSITSTRSGLHPNSPSLDKFYPELGYVRGNVAVISHRANSIKNNGSLEEHERLVAWMKNFASAATGEGGEG